MNNNDCSEFRTTNATINYFGVPLFYQSYEELKTDNPAASPYFSILLDQENKWIDHHDLGDDEPALHLDREHLYLLSYEKNTLIAHYKLDLNSL